MNSELISIPYFHPNYLDNTNSKRLQIYRIIHNNVMLIVENMYKKNPVLLRSPTQNKYLFADEGVIFVLNAINMDIYTLNHNRKQDVTTRNYVNDEENEVEIEWQEQPRWSKDGNKIAYLTYRLVQGIKLYSIWLYHYKNNNNKVYESYNQIELQGWTFHDELIIWEYDSSRMCIITLQGEVKHKFELGKVKHYYHAPNGECFLYTLDNQKTIIHLFCLNDLEHRKLLEINQDCSFIPKINFSRNGKRFITAMQSKKNRVQYVLFDFDTEQSRTYLTSIQNKNVVLPIWLDNRALVSPAF